MAQTGYTPISIYYSATASNTPTAGNLVAGELAINTADGKLFYKDSSGVVQTIASKGTGSVAGSTTQVIYNNAGAYAGSANMTFNGTTLTLANDASISGLTVGKGGGAVSANTAIGYQALNTNSTANENVAVGYQSLFTNNGARNVATGVQALYSNTSGTDNSAYGQVALYSNTTGIANTALGRQALYSNTTASNNTAVGYQAGYTSSTSNNSTYVGFGAGYSATGPANTAVGKFSGYSVTGNSNTFIGFNDTANQGSGYYITSGSKNSILGPYNGNQGGLDIRTASNYIVLSDGDGNPRLVSTAAGAVLINAVANTFSGPLTANTGYFWVYGPSSAGSFGASSYGATCAYFQRTQSDGTLLDFRRDTTTVGTISVTASATAYNTSSDYRLKENVAPMIGALDKVAKLKPVTYTWKIDGSDGEGFIAHELAEVCSQAVHGEKDAVDEEGKPKYQGIDTSFLVATLTAAIQELNAKVTALEAQLGK